jgi:hypothetical protein
MGEKSLLFFQIQTISETIVPWNILLRNPSCHRSII